MQAVQPWYREPWPWLLMSGPAIVIVAGTITSIWAFRTADPLVADDYYKQGLAVNRVLAREKEAERLGLQASVLVNAERDQVRVLLDGAGAAHGPLTLTLVHPTREGEDRTVPLAEESPGVYRGTMPALRGSAYEYQLQDQGGQWRLSGRWKAMQP